MSNDPLKSRLTYAYSDVLNALHIPKTSGTKETPERMAKAMRDLLRGYDDDVEAILARQFEQDDEDASAYQGIVLLRNIELYSLCEHHLLPFTGQAHVAYIPNRLTRKVVGISKLARVVDAYARRLQVQERLTCQIADAIEMNLQPQAVAVVIEAEHFCIRMRGVGKQNSVMTTSDMRGAFRDDGNVRQELMHLLSSKSV